MSRELSPSFGLGEVVLRVEVVVGVYPNNLAVGYRNKRIVEQVSRVYSDALLIGAEVPKPISTAFQVELVMLIIIAEGVRADVLDVACAVPEEQALVTTGMDALTGYIVWVLKRSHTSVAVAVVGSDGLAVLAAGLNLIVHGGSPTRSRAVVVVLGRGSGSVVAHGVQVIENVQGLTDLLFDVSIVGGGDDLAQGLTGLEQLVVNFLVIHGCCFLESEGANFAGTDKDAVDELADGVEVNLSAQDANLDAACTALTGLLLLMLFGEFVVNHGGSARPDSDGQQTCLAWEYVQRPTLDNRSWWGGAVLLALCVSTNMSKSDVDVTQRHKDG